MNQQFKMKNEILAHTGVKNPSPLFQEAFQQQSNREMEWLWYAEWVANDAEKRYCLQRALHINPASRAARRELDVLLRKQAGVTRPRQTMSLRRLVGSTFSTILFNILRRETNFIARE